MPAEVTRTLAGIAQSLEIVGAGALALGFVIATVNFVRQMRALGTLPAFHLYRQALARVVLIGLEILVAATIIKTITIDPTPAALGKLAVMIAIRTILSWTTALEMTGRWPWQGVPSTKSESPTTA